MRFLLGAGLCEQRIRLGRRGRRHLPARSAHVYTNSYSDTWRNGYTSFNSNSYCDAYHNSYTYFNFNSYSYSYSDCNCDRDANAVSYAHRQSDGYTEANAHCQTPRDSEAAPNVGTAAGMSDR